MEEMYADDSRKTQQQQQTHKKQRIAGAIISAKHSIWKFAE